MDKTVQVCVRCETPLAIGLKLHFCPYCGTAQLEKKLLERKSTQHYDPANPKLKPWRDKIRLPKRNYKVQINTKKLPWCPPMRQLRTRVPKAARTDDTTVSGNVNSEVDQSVSMGDNVENVDFEMDLKNMKSEYSSNANQAEDSPQKEAFLECKNMPMFVFMFFSSFRCIHVVWSLISALFCLFSFTGALNII